MLQRTVFALVALGLAGLGEARAASPDRSAEKEREMALFASLVALPSAKPVSAEAFAPAGTVKAASRVAVQAGAVRSSPRAAPAQTSISQSAALTPRGVALFDARLTRFLNRFGLTRTPPVTSFLPGRSIAFRKEFIIERFTPGATVDGVFFTTQATPFVPGSINVFNYFPVFLF
jgi:hypothetical protein